MAMDDRKQPEQPAPLHLARLFPNMLTLLGLCAGLMAIRWALDARWELSFLFIIAAACIDAVDGRLARILKSTSDFGAQLDSLADFLNFGVAPAFMLYLWNTHQIKGLGWAMVLFFAVCCAIRLARFNSELDDEKKEPWHDYFFVGMPAPAGALIGLGPLALTFAFKESYPDIYARLAFIGNSWFVCAWIAGVALLMASRLPTFSFKKIRIRREYASLILVAAGLLIIMLITEPWLTLSGLGAIYCLSLPVSFFVFCRLKTFSN